MIYVSFNPHNTCWLQETSNKISYMNQCNQFNLNVHTLFRSRNIVGAIMNKVPPKFYGFGTTPVDVCCLPYLIWLTQLGINIEFCN